jgi:hypothetical protein
MQEPDRLSPGGSLPIAGPIPTPTPPLKLHDFSLPGPSPTPDAAQRFIEQLLESIPVPPTIGPTQEPAPAAPTPAPPMPAPAAAPPSPLRELG